MKRGGGNIKGGRFERSMCKTFSKWVTGGKRTDVFWRTAMSGGRATVMARRGVDVRQSGDMCSVAPEGHVLTDYLFFEMKHLKRTPFEALLKSTGLLHKIWKKAQREAVRANRYLLLVVRQNGWPVVVIADGGAARFLKLEPRVIVRTHDMHVALLQDLLKTKPPARRIKLRGAHAHPQNASTGRLG